MKKRLLKLVSIFMVFFNASAMAGYTIGPPSTISNLAWSISAQSGSSLPIPLVWGESVAPVSGSSPSSPRACHFTADITGTTTQPPTTVSGYANVAVYGVVYCGKDGDFTMSGAGYFTHTPELKFTINNPLKGLTMSCTISVATIAGQCMTSQTSNGVEQTNFITLTPN